MFVHDAQQLSQLPWRVESTVVARTHRSGFASGVPSLHAFVPRRCWRGFRLADMILKRKDNHWEEQRYDQFVDVQRSVISESLGDQVSLDRCKS
uniref:Ovule protein n=1 Tax=Parascaris univalens TaxID=6257 RepID=A0A914ZSB2_PARUN